MPAAPRRKIVTVTIGIHTFKGTDCLVIDKPYVTLNGTRGDVVKWVFDGKLGRDESLVVDFREEFGERRQRKGPFKQTRFRVTKAGISSGKAEEAGTWKYDVVLFSGNKVYELDPMVDIVR